MKIEEPAVLKAFRDCSAIIEGGHFVLTHSGDGLHSAVYIEVFEVLSYIAKAHNLCYGIAERFVEEDVEVIIGLEGCGEILAPWTAQNMSNIVGRNVLGISANKVNDDLVGGKNVLVVDGILTIGDTARKVIAAVRKMGGNVVGLGALWNRGGVRAQDLDVPKLEALVNVKLDVWDEKNCLLCKQGVPINTKYGYGREFLAR